MDRNKQKSQPASPGPGRPAIASDKSLRPVPSASETYFFLVIQLGFAALVAYWFLHPPTAGYAVTVLALAAGAMSINEGIGRWRKGGWLLLLVLLAQLELRAISKDRTEQERQFVQTIGTITGGDSYARLSLKPISQDGLTYPWLGQFGVNPLRDVKIKLIEVSADGKPVLKKLLLPSRDVAVGERTQLLEYPILSPAAQRIEYVIYFDALNGHWTEQDSLRQVDGKWFEAAKVTRAEDSSGSNWKTLVVDVDPGYPLVNGKPDWSPF